ncbi:A/G specific adenine glycosylase [Legionella waltersii]|uniref:Adenine DNA glycosylase n=2 Tax=Legionella waltersii TaxID=66969 RepID=A0A0W1ANH9_9GAMM|nr:A/G specific adenine glycosylase [Legionella waltersii]SNV02084.1 A/G-specific adenine glycosylase [Legionella waltersii]
MVQFTEPLLHWYDIYGRKDFPWQNPRHPYRVWISEIMLQQTQVQTVIPYFNRFMSRFPDIESLAIAQEDDVLSYWSGLGYYSRARNLHKTAKIITESYEGHFPTDKAKLMQLPGIGPSTAAAIISQAFNKPAAILDGNVKRVLCRFFLIAGWPESTAVKNELWAIAQSCMHQQRCADYTQAIMDLGATCCTSRNPTCLKCPINENCKAFKQNEQAQYPNKKPKKQKPCYSQQFLAILNPLNSIYLDKRPPTGLWGGLWCLPSIEADANPLQWLSHFNLQSHEPQLITQFKHSFSHFDLEIKAILIKTELANNSTFESTGKWFTRDELSSVGLAKPTSLILSKVFSEE